MHTEDIYSDLRVMTLKRLAADFDLQMLSEGNYVSLSNYHFVDIWPVERKTGSFPISSFYEQREKRNKSSIGKNVHVIQNMLLFGKRPDFWEKKSCRETRILYITMVHFSNRVNCTPELFEEAVRNACHSPTDIEKISEDEQFIPEENWCVYYALDFCDAVIFMRGCSFDRYQELLWDLTVRGKAENRIVVDTISLYGVSSDKVRAKFRSFERGKEPPYRPNDKKSSSNTKDNFDLAIFLSVQNEERWSELQEKLEDKYNNKLDESHQNSESTSQNAEPAFNFYRKFGRTDITANLPSFDLENALYVVWLVFRHELSLESCSLSPLSALSHDGKSNCASATIKESSLSDAAVHISELYNKVSKRLQRLYKPLYGYLTEIHLSLQALLKNSFAEEYYLSVLPSFIAHLKLINEGLTLIETERRKKQDWMALADTLVEEDLREYYRCLMLLEQATVHGEKKYIQTPGLNAFICEVPAKLLAFYTSVAERIISRLCDDRNGKTYVPVLIPDFRQDMYSHSLPSNMSGVTQVGIIFLEERLFYEPEYTIPSMVHEIAHKVGDEARHREERLHSIFKCLSLYLLSTVLTEEALCEAKNAIDSLAEILATFFDERFREIHSEEAYLSKIIEFLESTNYCMALLELGHKNIIRRCSEAVNPELFVPLLKELGWRAEKSVFWERSELSSIAWETFFSTILNKIWIPSSDEKARQALEDYCTSLVSVFSEAYSDLRMLEHVGCDKRGDGYNRLLKQMLSRKDFFGGTETVGTDPRFFWRQVAVCKVLDFPFDALSDAEVFKPNGWDAFITRRTREELSDYLSLCHVDSVEKDETIAEYVETGCADIFKIRREIADFRDRLLRSFANAKQFNGAT